MKSPADPLQFVSDPDCSRRFLPLDAATNPPGADLHSPEGRRAGQAKASAATEAAGQPGVTPCRHDGLIQQH